MHDLRRGWIVTNIQYQKHPLYECRMLAKQIEAYQGKNRLPKEFAAVIGYIRYLKTVVEQ